MSETSGPGALRLCHCSAWHMCHLRQEVTCRMSPVQHGEGRPHSIPRPAPPQPDTQGRGSPWGHGGPVKAPVPRPVKAPVPRPVGLEQRGVWAGPQRTSTKELPPRPHPGRPWALGRPLRLPRESYTTARAHTGTAQPRRGRDAAPPGTRVHLEITGCGRGPV